MRNWVIPQLLQYNAGSTHSYYNTILSHFTVITIRSLITPQLLQYDTESFHGYYNAILSHPTVITIQYWVIPQLLQYDLSSPHSYYNTVLSHPTVITIRYWIIQQLRQYGNAPFHSFYNMVINPLNNDVSIVQKLVVKLTNTSTMLFSSVAKTLSKCIWVWQQVFLTMDTRCLAEIKGHLTHYHI